MRKSPLASLRKQDEFKRVYKHGKSAAMPLFVVYAAKNDLEFHRLGLSVSKKVGNAVVRNRVRRLIKEVCRQKFGGIPVSAGYDIVVIGRAPAGEMPREGAYAAVFAALSLLFKRLGIDL